MDRRSITSAAIATAMLGAAAIATIAKRGQSPAVLPSPEYNPAAPIIHKLIGQHARVARECHAAEAGLTCDFLNDKGERVVVRSIGGRGVFGADGGVMVVVRAPDGSWVMQ